MPSSSIRTQRRYRIDTCNAEPTRQDLGQSQSNRHGCASLAPEPHCLTGGENPALFTEPLLRRFPSRPAEEEVRSLPVVVASKKQNSANKLKFRLFFLFLSPLSLRLQCPTSK